MKERNANTGKAPSRKIRRVLACALFSLIVTSAAQMMEAEAESLFRASTTYDAQAPLRPRSLFTPPISREVGDLVTITINETATENVTSELKITRTQTIEENGSNFYNRMLSFMLGKVPIAGTKKVENLLKAPSFDGMDNANNLGSKAESKRNTTMNDTVTCQVVQVLPNGDLMVQGQKTIMANKERADLMVSGIVKPYYLDRFNQIPSSRVGNFQMLQNGKGVISRQQNDGIANKIYQFFN
ncbi:MAG: Flagellar L-ring protein [Vampirovibrio sp.]|jgi:flagellar L-ring protein precursor FlgH|nr:Flagellar L-ring protein [Vampirovibrio sp.]